MRIFWVVIGCLMLLRVATRLPALIEMMGQEDSAALSGRFTALGIVGLIGVILIRYGMKPKAKPVAAPASPIASKATPSPTPPPPPSAPG